LVVAVRVARPGRCYRLRARKHNGLSACLVLDLLWFRARRSQRRDGYGMFLLFCSR
jgi:hypothetical protein